MQQGWYPQQNKGISSSTQTQRTPQTRALSMGEKFCSQKKQTVPPPRGPQDCHTRDPPCRVSFTLSCLWQLTPLFWEEQTLSTATLMSLAWAPLPSLPDRPPWGFICLFSICHSDFAEDTPAATRHRPRNNPPVCALHCILDKEAARTCVKAKDAGLNHGFFKKKLFKSSGLSKASISHKSHVVMFSVHARGEQISKHF